MLSNLTCDFLIKLESSRNFEDLWLYTSSYLEKFDLTHSIYSYIDTKNPKNTNIWTSLPKYWRDRYKDREYHLRDPFYCYCCQTFRTVRTGPAYLDRYPFLKESERRIVLEGGETGFRSGFTAPVRLFGSSAFGGWNFGSTMGAASIESLIGSHGAEIRIASFCIHEYAQKLLEADRNCAESVSLSPRERECLLWLSRGFRTSAIAHRLGIAPVTVDLHFKGARRKLNAATREEALAKAILSGAIVP